MERRTHIAPGTAPAPTLALRLLGPMAVLRGGQPVALPPSRKVRALLAYLALAGRSTTRTHLCELLWDLPSDPRGELRWCLSKLRGVLDVPDGPRVLADAEGVALDLSDCTVDALQVAQGLQQGIRTLAPEQLEALAALLDTGELLEGLDLPRSPAFMGWLLAERRRFRAAHAAVLEHSVRTLPIADDATLRVLEKWVALAPFDRHAHERLLEALAARGAFREGEEHLAATARRYEAEGQDWAPIGRAWQAAKSRGSAGTGIALAPEPAATDTPRTRRASLVVMPFTDRSASVALRGGLADGLALDIITRLAKLRSMFVIAEGTMRALAERRMDSQEAARRLDVDYVASGSLLRERDGRLRVSVQLAESRTAQVLWAEEFSGPLDDTFTLLDTIVNRIVTALANQVEDAERNRAILRPPNSLDAWGAHHRGLWHMVRFHREDNEQARQFFQSAIRLDPTFARPHAGLSFTHFQDAFLGWREPGAAIEDAYRAAAEGLMADGLDPAAHWALARALWLKHRQDDAVRELQEAVGLSPNFAMAHYTLGFVHSQSGDPDFAITAIDEARALSPLDPLLFAMMASRAIALLRLGRADEAADWAARSAARPNAHVHISAIAMVCTSLAGRTQEAKDFAAAIRRAQPGYQVGNFLQAFRLGPEAESLVREAVRRLDA